MKLVWCAALVATAALTLVACGDDDDDDVDTPSGGDPTATTAASEPPKPAGLDTAFGTAGILSSPLSSSEHDRFMSVAIGNDGSVYAAGFVNQGGDQAMAVAKYKASGEMDKAFGKDGIAIVNVASGGKTAELARSITVTAGGKILIAGPIEHDTTATGDAAKDTDIAVVRLDSSGKLDTSFGREGIARVDITAGKATSATAFIGDTSWGLGALAGDKIALFASAAAEGEGRTDTDFVLVGLTAAGALDSAFGTAGKFVVDVSKQADNARHLSVQKDGKILATGYSTIDGVVQPVIIRTSASGQADTAFGTNGIATAKVLPGVTESYAIGFQGDAYVLGGYGRGADNTEKVDMIVYRFTASGQWDKTFGTDGVGRLDLAKEDDRARNVTVLADGRVLAVGSGKMNATNIDSMIVLWTKDGKINPEFGKSGNILSDLGGPADAWFGVAVSPDGKFAIAAGYKGTDANSGGNDDAVLAKITL